MANRYLALAIFILTSCSGGGQAQQYGLRGDQVTFAPDLVVQPENILWKLNGNKVVEFNGNVEDVYRTYKDRITLDWHSADLTITDLRYEDSGRYEMDAFIRGEELQSFHYELQVIDRVTKPNISCEMNNGSSSNSGPASGSLLCSAESRPPQSSLTYVWTSHGEVASLSPRLSISLGDEYDDEIYSCQVSNPLSSETATFTAKDCYPESLSPALIAVLVILTIAVVIICVGLGIKYCQIKRKACFAEDAEKAPAIDESETDKSRGLHRASTRPSNQPLAYQAHVGSGGDPEQDPLLPKGGVKEAVRLYEQIGQQECKNAGMEPEDMEETQTSEDNLKQTSKAISEEENEPVNEGDDKGKENLSSAASQQPPSPTPTGQDIRNSKTLQESPIPAHVEPDQDQDAGDPGSDSQSEEGEDGKAVVTPVSPETPPPAQPQPLLTTTPPQNTEPEDTAEEHAEEIQRGEDNQQEASKAGSEHENESDKEADDKEMKNERNLSLDASQQSEPESDKPGSDSQSEEGEDGKAVVTPVSPESPPPAQPQPLLTTTQPQNTEPEDTAEEPEKEIHRGEDNQQEASEAGSEHENEPDNEGDDKEMRNERNLSLDTSQQSEPESDKPAPVQERVEFFEAMRQPNKENAGFVAEREPDEDEKSAALPETSDPVHPYPPLIEASSPKDTDDDHEESDSDHDTQQPSVPEPKVESQNVKTGKTEIVGESEEQHHNGTVQAGEGEGGGLPVHDQIQHEPKESDCSGTNQR